MPSPQVKPFSLLMAGTFPLQKKVNIAEYKEMLLLAKPRGCCTLGDNSKAQSLLWV